MVYRLNPGRRIDRDARRVAAQQLRRAILKLRRVGDPASDRTIHDGRRHVKKIRALVRLLGPSLSGRHGAHRRLRRVTRMLAPIADGEALVGLLNDCTIRVERETTER